MGDSPANGLEGIPPAARHFRMVSNDPARRAASHLQRQFNRNGITKIHLELRGRVHSDFYEFSGHLYLRRPGHLQCHPNGRRHRRNDPLEIATDHSGRLRVCLVESENQLHPTCHDSRASPCREYLQPRGTLPPAAGPAVCSNRGSKSSILNAHPSELDQARQRLRE